MNTDAELFHVPCDGCGDDVPADEQVTPWLWLCEKCREKSGATNREHGGEA